MARRTDRRCSTSPQLTIALLLLLSYQSTLAAHSQGTPSKTLKQRMLVRELILLQGCADKANQTLISNVEALAKQLPVLLSYTESQSTINLNDNPALLARLESVVGPNPFDQEIQLKDELARTRMSLEANGVGKVNDGLRQAVQAKRSRIFFRRPTVINPTEPVRTVDSLMAEDGGLWPGTINVMVDPTGSYVVFATGLDSKSIKADNKTVCKSGHLQ